MSEPWSTTGVDLLVDALHPGGRRAGLERALRDAVWDGRFMAGSRLPSTRALAAELGLARGTVTAAYEQLTAEGYLIATPSTSRYDLRPGSPDVASFPAGM